MEPIERKRYSRQIILPEMGMAGQEKLKAAKVLVIGAGGLGCPVLQYLVAAGVGTIGIVDDDTVDVTNLHRQILYSADDLGKGKAETAVQKLTVMNPYVNLKAIAVRLDESNAAEIIAGYDLVIDGSDNFPTRYLANDVCVGLNKPLVFGSILRFEGQVSVFNYKGGPTYRCLFPEAEEGDNCEVAGVIGILPGIIGTYMANETIKIICDIGEVLSGKLLILNALGNTNNIFSFSRSSDFPVQENLNIETGIEENVKRQTNEMPFEDLENLLESGDENVFLIDVRENYEFEEDFIGGINIPLPELPENLHTMPADKTVVFYCHSGKRSKLATDLLIKSGFTGKSYWAKNNMSH
ncbi:HesA/MoeB/ThiF family protein [Dyadobacter psychrotolerans]|uniref:Molybdopterin-synthase adenylyltransferase n=1 Tax=Dyadobacter psychrotolerans TaxID=2541721 RepID=A0A4R5E1Z7_9BACT|nr:HesA/MoeB/ThiF family protein [Dyadobacter psychrotolerans]TDE18215.1 molybdopterin-synthase adenylyltransferase MoeB [Dyadobacter psychrotolerans]